MKKVRELIKDIAKNMSNNDLPSTSIDLELYSEVYQDLILEYNKTKKRIRLIDKNTLKTIPWTDKVINMFVNENDTEIDISPLEHIIKMLIDDAKIKRSLACNITNRLENSLKGYI